MSTPVTRRIYSNFHCDIICWMLSNPPKFVPSLHVWVPVCRLVCVHVYVCMNEYEDQMCVFPKLSLSPLLKQSLLNMEFMNLTRLAGQWAPEISLSHPYALETHDATPGFYSDSGKQLSYPRLCSKHFANWTISPALSFRDKAAKFRSIISMFSLNHH